MIERIFLDQGAVTVDIQNQLRNALRKSKGIKCIINNPLIQTTIIISIMDIIVRNQIRASDVDQRIISLQIFRYWTLWIRKFTVTQKIQKLVHTDRRK